VRVRDGPGDRPEGGFSGSRIGRAAVVDRERRAFVLDLHAGRQRRVQRVTRRFEGRAVGGGFRGKANRAIGPRFQPVIAGDDQPRHANPLAHVRYGSATDHRYQREVRAQRVQQGASAGRDLGRVGIGHNRADRPVHVRHQPQARLVKQRAEQVLSTLPGGSLPVHRAFPYSQGERVSNPRLSVQRMKGEPK